MITRFLVLTAFLLGGLSRFLHAADLLVLMHDSGTVERYDTEGRHLGTFIQGLHRPNALLLAPDGNLYISTGVPGGHGSVEKFDARSGLKLDTFISIPSGQPGHLARATGMAWHEGDLLVASQGDGKVKRYDGKSAAWKSDVAIASPGGITQIAIRGRQLFLTDFSAQALRISDMSGNTSPAPEWTRSEGHAPWGLVFDEKGNAFWSTSANRILRFDGRANAEWVGAAGGLATPVWLAIGPDGHLYAANLSAQNVSVWRMNATNSSAPLRTFGDRWMRSPISIAFASQTYEPPLQIGNFVPQPSNTGKNWTPGGKAIYNLRAAKSAAAFTEMGIDTEGGDRAKTNLLREPMRLVFTFPDGSRIDSSRLAANAKFGKNEVHYSLSPIDGVNASWRVWVDKEDLLMSFSLSGPAVSRMGKVELFIPFDPRAMGTTVLSEEWGEGGAVKSPLIISALDMGQLHLTGKNKEKLDCVFTGSRLHEKLDLRVVVLPEATRSRTLVFVPARLEKPSDRLTNGDWMKIRRGLISLIQITAYVPPHEEGSTFLGSPGGISGNNVLSDPVSCLMERNFQWLAGMRDKAIIRGINLNKVARKTIEFWLNHRMNEDGSIDYVLQKGNISADSNTGVLNAATDYYLSTGDRRFVRRNKNVLVKAANYLVARDLDDDGLIETFRDGNGQNQFGDTAYDTISSGWKNALVNGQAYKSFLGVARLMDDIGEKHLAESYRQRAVRLRIAYNRQFYDAEKGRYIWWIGKDGRRHDYGNPLIQANAVLFGIADRLEQDTGIMRGSREVMNSLWKDLDEAEYFDSAKAKTVDYIDSKTGNYAGFYWGIPNNLEDVPDAFNFQSYGSYEFPFYCNGGIFPQDTVATIMAFASAGMSDKAAIIQREIFRRQHEGILANGSGFYMGVLNGTQPCYSIMKWDGTPTDYEGIISRDCAFLQTAILAKDPAHELFKAKVSEELP